ncbi:hypothetical protein [Spiroplasma endosymbiont of Panorpa germanica]|uniref:hypothetical protein n=1 Tax=Spiroplasma endosymbiont of Panorpa germanica TaxID=3066314 RepID=UPI0030CC8A59
MKKLLGILATLGLTTATVGTTIACGNNKTEEPDKISSGDLGDEKVISVRNVVVDRNVSKQELIAQGADNSKITSQGIVDGINYANNTALTVDDIEIEFNNEAKTMAIITAKSDSKFSGTVNMYLNFDVDIQNIIKKTDIGNIYISKEVWDDKTTITLATLLAEFIGDRNPILEGLADQMFKLSMSSLWTPGLIEIGEDVITFNFDKLDDATCFIKGIVSVKFIYNDDNRLTIKEAVTQTDLGKIANNQKETILKRVYELNKSNMKQITEADFIKYTIVAKEEGEPKNDYIQFLAGTSLFKGHDDTAAQLIGLELEDIHLPITYTV